ncbi:MAG: hypothetical protein WAV15_00215 [Minisyncoccia bacterium]
MSHETGPSDNIGRIALEDRNLIQFRVAELLGEGDAHEKDDAWLAKTMARFKTVSAMIDDPKNKNIHDLIMSGQLEEAAKLIVKILKRKEVNKNEAEAQAA